ncbi:N-6 DNA methylase [Lichenihabitans sp. Uapishka_5]|uniref:Eco57I restriction-modification methylase domain-containing protein n=1 Tax=Lichenihabitans sp. Uapishka_5 TaxID=3037302 RepID=UPI0029E81275|nr:N-6 DNA methylase [Lichenihabitans sp. Uapishka_5]MDX7952417.1 N-6 DNA methylase [Lichenihabitans sp. Uapishka_5]
MDAIDPGLVASVSEHALAVQAVHRHCGVFTDPRVARGVLDAVGWSDGEDLQNRRLLEPACGDGSFLLPAAESLIASLVRQGHRISKAVLGDVIVGYEFDEVTAAIARSRLSALLVASGLPERDAASVVRGWVRCDDFLLTRDDDDFTHVVGNPPYMRWSKVPHELRSRYERCLPSTTTRGDLCLPFIWRALEASETRAGCVAFVCVDRWLRCAYGERVRAELSTRVRVARHFEVHHADVFAGSRRVDAYAAVTILDRRLDARPTFGKAATVPELLTLLEGRLHTADRATKSASGTGALRARGGAIITSSDLAQAYESLAGPRLSLAGVTVRCGLALGASEAFVVDRNAAIEPDRLVAFVRARDLGNDGTVSSSKCIVNPWAEDGRLVRLDEHPLMKAHLEPHAAELRKRACVKRPENWYRTIDRVRLDRVADAKILVAGMSNSARIWLSNGGVQPSNSLYALSSSEWPLRELSALLGSGVLDLFASVLAPTFSGNTKRFDGNVLGQVRIPRWSDVGPAARRSLRSIEGRPGVPNPALIADVYRVARVRYRSLERALLSLSDDTENPSREQPAAAIGSDHDEVVAFGDRAS